MEDKKAKDMKRYIVFLKQVPLSTKVVLSISIYFVSSFLSASLPHVVCAFPQLASFSRIAKVEGV